VYLRAAHGLGEVVPRDVPASENDVVRVHLVRDWGRGRGRGGARGTARVEARARARARGKG